MKQDGSNLGCKATACKGSTAAKNRSAANISKIMQSGLGLLLAMARGDRF